MRRRLTITAVVVAGLAVLAVLLVAGRDGDDASTQSGVPGLEARTVEAGAVTAKVEPRQLDDQGAVFAIALDTHSVELDADLARAATLTVDGVAWPGATWSGDPPGGHHRDGELRFAAAGPVTATVVLSIAGLDEPIEETWTLPTSAEAAR